MERRGLDMWFQYDDRAHAGRVLAMELRAYGGRPDVRVLALPRGGVPVGVEVAAALEVPLDIVVVRKLGVPGEEELAMGAVATGGVRALNEELVSALGIPDDVLDAATARERREVERRERAWRGDRPPVDPAGCVAILVDDGLATGSTMRAAASAVRARGPARLVVAVPVASPETAANLAREVDELVCPLQPPNFFAVGTWYRDFTPTGDDEVRELLARAQGTEQPAAPG